MALKVQYLTLSFFFISVTSFFHPLKLFTVMQIILSLTPAKLPKQIENDQFDTLRNRKHIYLPLDPVISEMGRFEYCSSNTDWTIIAGAIGKNRDMFNGWCHLRYYQGTSFSSAPVSISISLWFASLTKYEYFAMFRDLSLPRPFRPLIPFKTKNNPALSVEFVPFQGLYLFYCYFYGICLKKWSLQLPAPDNLYISLHSFPYFQNV